MALERGGGSLLPKQLSVFCAQIPPKSPKSVLPRCTSGVPFPSVYGNSCTTFVRLRPSAYRFVDASRKEDYTAPMAPNTIDLQQVKARRRRTTSNQGASANSGNLASPGAAIPSDDTRHIDFLIGRYLAHHRRHNRSPKTILWHRDSLRDFTTFFEKNAWRLDIDEDPKVLLAHARAWLDDLYVRPSCWGRPYSADSLNTKVRSVRAFFAWLSEEDYTPFHYLEKLERPVLGKKHPKALSGSQLEQVLLAPQLVPTTYLGVRNLAMVLVYLDTWCRLTEVTELDIRDVHLDDGWMKILGKGNREAIVRLSSQTVEVLTRYIDQWRPKPKRGQTHLFLQKDGTNLGPRAVQSLMARIGESTGIPLSPHRLRHTGATAGARKGMSLDRIQAKLRHTTSKATVGYIGLAAEIDQHQSGLDLFDHIEIKLPRKARKPTGR